MADLIIRKIPEDLRNQFKALCASKGSNMREEIIKFMKQAVEKATRKD
ncbi:MAG: copy number control protein [Planctomycetes bacterium]|nr:copy number control protein [Planctomycetota bacterium]